MIPIRVDNLTVPSPDSLAQAAIEAIKNLYSARLAAATEAVRLAEMERRLRLAQAEAEARVIQNAGGDEKALGPNAEARARALTIAVAQDEEYRKALEGYQAAALQKAAADAVAEALREYVSVLKAMIRSSETELPPPKSL